MNLSSLYQLDLARMKFTDCSLHEIDFTEANLKSISFNNCDLASAIFENTILEKVDFRTAVNYSIDPENNVVEKAKFSQSGIAGLLIKYNIEIE
ncbi:MAG: pentapeptide repeat-containing protein [Flavobacteriaceae bacterium]|nr:pentapeptide repeat-containing protein [Flavobacteriaceae bacterium]